MLGKHLIFCRNAVALLVVGAVCSAIFATGVCSAAGGTEVLRYEVTWNGNKAGHGDITTRRTVLR